MHHLKTKIFGGNRRLQPVLVCWLLGGLAFFSLLLDLCCHFNDLQTWNSTLCNVEQRVHWACRIHRQKSTCLKQSNAIRLASPNVLKCFSIAMQGLVHPTHMVSHAQVPFQHRSHGQAICRKPVRRLPSVCMSYSQPPVVCWKECHWHQF